MTLGGLLKHLAWVEELYFQHGSPIAVRAPFDQLDLESDWEDWAWSTAADDTPDALRALWVDTVHRSREALAEALSRGGLEQTTPNGMSLRRLLADMIEEYARHTGHADLLREQVDGTTEKALRGTSRSPEARRPAPPFLTVPDRCAPQARVGRRLVLLVKTVPGPAPTYGESGRPPQRGGLGRQMAPQRPAKAAGPIRVLIVDDQDCFVGGRICSTSRTTSTSWRGE